MKLEQLFMSFMEAPSRPRAIRVVDDEALTLGSDIGVRRSENQDRVAAMVQRSNHGSTLYCAAIADGMGGMQDGAYCASLCLAAFFVGLTRDTRSSLSERLMSAARFANSQVFRHARGKGGSTLSAIAFTESGQVIGVNVGDSRIFSSPASGVSDLRRLTTDDTMEELLGAQGRELIQFVGIGEGIKPHIVDGGSRDDVYLLTSDGTHFVGQENLQNIVEHAPDRRTAAERMLNLARWFGGPDNATIALVQPNAWRDADAGLNPPSIRVWNAERDVFVVAQFEPSRPVPPAPPEQRETSHVDAGQDTTKRGRKKKSGKAADENKKSEQLQIEISIPSEGPTNVDSQ